MHDYLFTAEVVRFAFVFGVATSMLLYERRHLTTGSIVVPGYVATFAVFPSILLATAVNSGLSYLIVNKVLNRWFLLYGRTKFTVLALISIAIQTAMLKLSPSGAWLWESDIKLIVGVGYVVPALIAHDMGRQGVMKTIRSVSLASVIVLIPIAIALWIDLPGVNDLAPLTGVGRMAIDAPWIPVAVLLSAASAWGVSHNYGLRSGGFMGASFIAILLGDPWQVGVAISLALGTYLFVTRLLMNEMILFGRRKFSAMLLVSATASWIMLWTGSEVLGIDALQHVDVGALALTPLIVPGLVANDAQRTGPSRVLAGLSLATVFVLATTWWVQSIVQQSSLPFGWKVLSMLSFGCIFWPQLSPSRFMVRAGDTEVALAPAIPLGNEPAPVFGFSINGYLGWAAMHRSAAEAADTWLSALIGPSLQPAIVAPAPVVVAPLPSPIRSGAPTERIARWRAAARRALASDPSSAPSARRAVGSMPANRRAGGSPSANRRGADVAAVAPVDETTAEKVDRWRLAAVRAIQIDAPRVAASKQPAASAQRIDRWRTAARRELARDGAVSAAAGTSRVTDDVTSVGPHADAIAPAVADRIAAALPRRQATGASLAPVGPMIGAASLLPKHPPMPAGDPSDHTSGVRPAARVVPSSAPGSGSTAPVEVALPHDDVPTEPAGDNAPTRDPATP